jgi:hypothetical protein
MTSSIDALCASLSHGRRYDPPIPVPNYHDNGRSVLRICDPVTEARAVGRDEDMVASLDTELTEEYLDTLLGGHNERFIYIEMCIGADTTSD